MLIVMLPITNRILPKQISLKKLALTIDSLPLPPTQNIEWFLQKCTYSNKAVVPKVCPADPKGSATISQGIRGYVSVMATLKFGIFSKIIAELL